MSMVRRHGVNAPVNNNGLCNGRAATKVAGTTIVQLFRVPASALMRSVRATGFRLWQ